MTSSFIDNGGRRSGVDRRQFAYDIHIPERRSGEDRRSGIDRRSGMDRKKIINTNIVQERRSAIERKKAHFSLG